MIRPALPRVAAPLLAAALAACATAAPSAAGPRGEAPAPATRAALDAVVAGDPRADAALDAALDAAPRDPWALTGEALLARRALDRAREAALLLRVVAETPDGPLGLVGLRRLGELADDSPALAERVRSGLAPLLASGRLRGLAAFRARVAALDAAGALGDPDEVVRLRAENGAITAWSLAGPFGALHALDFERRGPPEEGNWPAAVPGALLAPAHPTRGLSFPDGAVSLDGLPDAAAVSFLASEVELPAPAHLLAVLATSGSARAWIDGRPLLERRGWGGPSSVQLLRTLDLDAGRHRVLVELAGAGGRPSFILDLARADGGAGRIASRPLPPGALPIAAAGPWPPPEPAAGLAAALAAGGPALGRLLAALDAAPVDVEAAKALVEEALAAAPRSALLLSARGLIRAADTTLDDRIRQGRVEADLRAALALDPAEGEARLLLARELRLADRAEDAEALLADLPPALAVTAAALAERARVAGARGQAARADGLAGDARRAGGSCEALRLLAESASRRAAVAEEDEVTAALQGCRDGRERLIRLRLRRGDPAGALAALAPLLRQRPAAIEVGLARGVALAAAGDAAGARDALEVLLPAWPDDARLARQAADRRELAGDAAGARALRERALALDGGDLTLRRALALDAGKEVLDDAAIDTAAALAAYRAAPRREDASSVMILDAAAQELGPGGGGVTRVHQVTKVLDQEAVDHAGEVSLPGGAQLLALRTLKPDGRILEPDGGEGKGSLSLTGLEVGDVVDLEYLVPDGAPHAGLGIAADAFYFASPGVNLFRSTYLARAPRGLGLEVDAHRVPAPPVEAAGEEEEIRVERTEVPAVIPEPGAPPAPEFVPFVQVGAAGGREAVQRALADALAGRTAATLEVRALAREVRAAAGPGAGPEALARAAYAAARLQVVGTGGGTAGIASEILSRGRGSRLLLLAALLDELGVPARVAAIRPFGGDATAYRFPSPGLWGGRLLRLSLPGRIVWLDPTYREQPFGAIDEELLGAEALVLPHPGEPLEVDRTPDANPGPSGQRTEARIALAADGSATIDGLFEVEASSAGGIKAALAGADERQRRQALEELLGAAFRGVSVGALAILGDQDPGAPLAIRWHGRAEALARADAGGLVIDAPLAPVHLGAHLVRLAARTTPLLVDAASLTTLRIELVPPAGLAARAAPAAALRTPLGTFERTERVEAGVLVREERLAVPRGRIAPADYPALAAFAAGVDAVEGRPTVLAPR